MNSCSKLFLLLLTALPILSSADTPSCALIPKVLEEASRIRGLSFTRTVPCELHNRDQIKKFILDTVDTKLPPKKLKYEEQLYKAIGLIPEKFDYQKELVDFYATQIGGYYDPEKKRYIMASWMPELLQEPVAAHELTHALQDQHFNLETFLDNDKFTSDELLARSALVEGDATAIMLDYSRAQAGMSPIADEQDMTLPMMSNVLNLGLVSGGEGIPEALKFLMIFPYTSGLRFCHQLVRKGGYKEVDKVFLDPPKSTEEILHPEKYGHSAEELQRWDPAKEHLGNIPADVKVLYQDTLGEFFIATFLGSFIDKSEAVAAAGGWGGDVAAISKDHIWWVTRWDTEKDAEEFESAFRKARGIIDKDKSPQPAATISRSGLFVTFSS
jgi:hypothetical protein